MQIFGIDPGAVTGVAAFDDQSGRWEMGEITSPSDAVDWLWDRAVRGDVVVIERATGASAAANLPAQVGGMMAACAQLCLSRVVWQMPQERIPHMHAALDVSCGRGGHARDAAAHVLAFSASAESC